MKPFNLEQALAGAPLVTRDGRKVTAFRFDAGEPNLPCGGIVDDIEPFHWKSDGSFFGHGYRGTPHDLFMANDDALKAEDNGRLDICVHVPTGRLARQKKIAEWCAAAFGAEHQASLPQRGIRMLEEAAEASQAAGVDLAMAHRLLDHVWGKPAGDLHQELGGIGVTVLALAEAAGLDADEAEVVEVARVLSKPLDHFKQRNQAKNDAGFNVIKPGAGATLAECTTTTTELLAESGKLAEVKARVAELEKALQTIIDANDTTCNIICPKSEEEIVEFSLHAFVSGCMESLAYAALAGKDGAK